MLRILRGLFVVVFAAATSTAFAETPTLGRRAISLDGTWQIAQGGMDSVPDRFDRRVPVPGLVDMAEPAFEAVGSQSGKDRRQAFWYRRALELEGPVPEVARLKIHKAKFGTRVFLNGKLVGDHVPCFTPGWFDVAGVLRGAPETNDLVVRVGAGRDAVPKSVPDGWDFEKTRYIPGIYDSIELILSGSPYVARLQTVPDLQKQAVRVKTVVKSTSGADGVRLNGRVREVSSGKVVGTAESGPLGFRPGEEQTVDLEIPIRNCRLWSPEDPFLYELEASTGADTQRVRFGMRTFRFDRKTGRAVLNGKPYPMRGTNVCIYRFFEDPARGDLPWREAWVRGLHRLFRRMHWNSMRYCIGFPPEAWYDVADEEGLLIQDEFPIWHLSQWPDELTSDELVKEYTEWMEERWNHPCVAIWDAQNESRTAETGKAIQAVRGLDLSNRPWDNGWSPPQSPTDVFEAHPYPFYSAKGSGKPTSFRLSGFADAPGAPGVPGGIRGNVFLNEGKNPVIINEYGWLWLNRDGTPTTLSEANYEALLGPDSTTGQRRRLYARYLAAMTEFWRCRRQVAGVLHFCGLGYSRPGGETSDHFLDLEKLTLDPEFEKYVGDAFAPVGLMIDYWAEEIPAGKECEFPVVAINDLQADWQGTVRLRLLRAEPVAGEARAVRGSARAVRGSSDPAPVAARSGDLRRAVLDQASQPCEVESLGSTTLRFQLRTPDKPGRYQLVAELSGADGKPVRSWRDVAVAGEP